MSSNTNKDVVSPRGTDSVVISDVCNSCVVGLTVAGSFWDDPGCAVCGSVRKGPGVSEFMVTLSSESSIVDLIPSFGIKLSVVPKWNIVVSFSDDDDVVVLEYVVSSVICSSENVTVLDCLCNKGKFDDCENDDDDDCCDDDDDDDDDDVDEDDDDVDDDEKE